MKKTKYSISSILSILYVLITGAINVYGYFHLPGKIATQFSLSGENVNHMSTPIYVTITSAIVLILSVLCIRSEREQKIKYFLINSLIFVANIGMIVTQL